MTHTIREYNQTDIDVIKDCIRDLQDFEKLMDSQRLEGIKIAEDYLAHLLEMCERNKGKIFVVEVNEEIVGMISVVIEEDSKHLRKIKRFATITDLIVMPEYQGNGISKTLIEKAEEYAKSQNVDTIQVHQLSKYEKGLKNYLRNGFSEFEIVLRKKI
jgi:GNAT superfamily N-acetyltransferase